jgi:hypothetical protein
MVGIYLGFAILLVSTLAVAYAIGGPIAAIGLSGVWLANAFLD